MLFLVHGLSKAFPVSKVKLPNWVRLCMVGVAKDVYDHQIIYVEDSLNQRICVESIILSKAVGYLIFQVRILSYAECALLFRSDYCARNSLMLCRNKQLIA